MKKIAKNKLFIPAIFLIAALLLSLSGFYYIQNSKADAFTWSSNLVSTSVAADANNTAVYSLVNFNSSLYLGTNSATGGEIWRSNDGSTWTQVNTDGFGTVNNTRIYSLTVFNSQLYAGTSNNAQSLEIWRSSDGSTWSAVVDTPAPAGGTNNTSGFGDPNNTEAVSMYVYGSNLYVGTHNNFGLQIWRSADGLNWTNSTGATFGPTNIWLLSMNTFNGSLYVGTLRNAGSRIYSCSTCDGTDWALSGNSDNGFGDINNIGIYSLAVFNSELYAGTEKQGGAINGEVWKTSDGTTWSQVGTDGFGGTANSRIFYSLFPYQNNLYLGTVGVAFGGASLPTKFWGLTSGAISVGTNPEQKNADTDNWAGTSSIINFNNYLYTAGSSSASVASVYRADLRPSIVASSVTATPIKDGTGHVTLSFGVNDNDKSDVRAQIEYSTDNGATWKQATMGSTVTATYGTPQVSNSSTYQIGTAAGYISTSSGANTITATWNSKSDIPTTDSDAVLVRVTPNDLVTSGDSATSAAIDIDNVAPTFSGYSVNPTKAKKGTVISIEFTVSVTPSGNPTVKVDGNSATQKKKAGKTYLFEYTVKGTEKEGSKVDVVTTAKDTYQNTGTKTSHITLDFTAPKITASPAGGIYNAKQSVKLTSNETANIYYTIDNTNPTTNSTRYVNPLELSQDVVVKFIGKDTVGNQSAVKSEQYIFDYVAPTTKAVPPGGTYINPQSVRLEANKPATIYFTLDGSSPTNRSSVYNNPILISQNTTLKFFGIDTAGNQEFTKTEQYVISSTSPSITLSKSVAISGTSSISSTGSSQLIDKTKIFIKDFSSKAYFHLVLISLISFWTLVLIILFSIIFFKNKKNFKKACQIIFKKQKVAFLTILFVISASIILEIGIGLNSLASTIYQGNTLTYRVDYQNSGSQDTNDLRIVDSIDSNTTYLSQSLSINGIGQTDAKDSDQADYNITNPSAATFDIGKVASNTSGYLEFKVSVNYSAPQDAIINNNAVGSYNPGGIFTQSNTVSNIVYIPGTGGPIKPEKKDDKEKTNEEIKTNKEIIINEEIKINEEIITKPVEGILEILRNEKLQQINKDIVAPVIAIATIINVLAAIPIVNSIIPFVSYLTQFVTHPTMFFGKKKRKNWGVVYNSLTREPIDLAVVRLFNKQNNKLVATRITDFQGRYLFVVDPGEYYVSVAKAYFDFPSKFLAIKNPNDYLGETISTQSNNQNSNQQFSDIKNKQSEQPERGVISFNIPVDPKEGYITNPANPSKVIHTSIRTVDDLRTLPQEKINQEDQKLKNAASSQKVKYAIAIIGPIIGLIALIISPSILTAVLALINILLFFLFKKLATKKVSSWGKTYDSFNKKSLPKTVVRLFDTQYNRLLLTDISKNDGKYGFLVGTEKYLLTANKENYKLPQDRIEIRGGKEGLISKDLGLEKS